MKRLARHSKRATAASVALLVLAACAARSGPAAVPLGSTVRVPDVEAFKVVEQGDATFVFEPTKIAILRGGVVGASVPLPSTIPLGLWTGAASIPALDGNGRWVVAARQGSLWRVSLEGELERIDDRFGLGPEVFVSIAAAGSTIAIGLDHAIAVSTDGVHLARYATTGVLAVARDRLAIATDNELALWDLVHSTKQTFAIASAQPLFLTGKDRSRLVAVTKSAIWLETSSPALESMRRVDVPGSISQVKAAGERLWVESGTQLYMLDGDTLVRTDAKLAAADILFGAPNGDIWVNTYVSEGDAMRGGDLRRYSVDHPSSDPRWTADVGPVFQRVCAHCHLPGGSADVDLSTPATWAAEHDEIVRRVMVTRTMPPAGTDLSDADRQALAGWLGVKL